MSRRRKRANPNARTSRLYGNEGDLQLHYCQVYATSDQSEWRIQKHSGVSIRNLSTSRLGVKGPNVTVLELTSFLSSFRLTEPHTEHNYKKSEKFTAWKIGGISRDCWETEKRLSETHSSSSRRTDGGRGLTFGWARRGKATLGSIWGGNKNAVLAGCQKHKCLLYAHETCITSSCTWRTFLLFY